MNKLWIRTQNKKSLIDIQNVAIIGTDICANVTIIQENDKKIVHKYVLGKYNTEEDAMKVLYEIERALISPTAIVFQMPAKDLPRSNYAKQ